MSDHYIRLDDKFIFRKSKKFYLTNIRDISVWSDMTTKQKERSMGKDVTKKIKDLLKKHGSKVNIHFKTEPSKKKIRKTARKTKGG